MLEVVITVHDQKIVLDFEKNGKYRDIPKYSYAFVGSADCEMIRHLPNVVVVRELDVNIEKYKNLVDFTAWYAFSRNKLISSDFVSLLQYDTAISKDFYSKTISALSSSPERMLGYQKWPIADENFIDNNVGAAPLAEALADVYGVDLHRLVAAYVEASDDVSWPSSNNLAMSRHILNDYVNWFDPMIDHLGPNLYSGHSVERSLKIFCILKGVENFYAPELAHHYQLNSHGTQGFEVEFEKEILRVSRNELPASGGWRKMFEKIRRRFYNKS